MLEKRKRQEEHDPIEHLMKQMKINEKVVERKKPDWMEKIDTMEEKIESQNITIEDLQWKLKIMESSYTRMQKKIDQLEKDRNVLCEWFSSQNPETSYTIRKQKYSSIPNYIPEFQKQYEKETPSYIS